MKIWVIIAASLILASCDDGSRDAVTFSCEASQESAVPNVLFRYEGGFLFVQNDSGGADNVCSQEGTLICEVKMSRDSLTFRQVVEEPECEWRSSLKTSLDINRHSGAFEFTQVECDPLVKTVVTGFCDSRLGK